MNFKRLAWLIVPVVAVPLVVGSGVAAWWFAGQNNSTTTEQPLSQTVATEAKSPYVERITVLFGDDATPLTAPKIKPTGTSLEITSPMKTTAVLKNGINSTKLQLDVVVSYNPVFLEYFDVSLLDSSGNLFAKDLQEDQTPGYEGNKMQSGTLTIPGTANPGQEYVFEKLFFYGTYKEGKMPQNLRDMGKVVDLINNQDPAKPFLRIRVSVSAK